MLQRWADHTGQEGMSLHPRSECVPAAQHTLKVQLPLLCENQNPATPFHTHKLHRCTIGYSLLSMLNFQYEKYSLALVIFVSQGGHEHSCGSEKRHVPCATRTSKHDSFCVFTGPGAAAAGLTDTFQASAKVQHLFSSTSIAPGLGKGRVPASSLVNAMESWGSISSLVFVHAFHKTLQIKINK